MEIKICDNCKKGKVKETSYITFVCEDEAEKYYCGDVDLCEKCQKKFIKNILKVCSDYKVDIDEVDETYEI